MGPQQQGMEERALACTHQSLHGPEVDGGAQWWYLSPSSSAWSWRRAKRACQVDAYMHRLAPGTVFSAGSLTSLAVQVAFVTNSYDAAIRYRYIT